MCGRALADFHEVSAELDGVDRSTISAQFVRENLPLPWRLLPRTRSSSCDIHPVISALDCGMYNFRILDDRVTLLDTPNVLLGAAAERDLAWFLFSLTAALRSHGRRRALDEPLTQAFVNAYAERAGIGDWVGDVPWTITGAVCRFGSRNLFIHLRQRRWNLLRNDVALYAALQRDVWRSWRRRKPPARRRKRSTP